MINFIYMYLSYKMQLKGFHIKEINIVAYAIIVILYCPNI